MNWGSNPYARTIWRRGGTADTADLKSAALYGREGSSPSGATNLVLVMKTAKTTERNPFAVPAKKRRAGKMRPKKDKRKSGKNKQTELLKEADK